MWPDDELHRLGTIHPLDPKFVSDSVIAVNNLTEENWRDHIDDETVARIEDGYANIGRSNGVRNDLSVFQYAQRVLGNCAYCNRVEGQRTEPNLACLSPRIFMGDPIHLFLRTAGARKEKGSHDWKRHWLATPRVTRHHSRFYSAGC